MVPVIVISTDENDRDKICELYYGGDDGNVTSGCDLVVLSPSSPLALRSVDDETCLDVPFNLLPRFVYCTLSALHPPSSRTVPPLSCHTFSIRTEEKV